MASPADKSPASTIEGLISQTLEEFDALERRISDPAVIAQPAAYRDAARRHGQMKRLADLCRRMRDVRAGIVQAQGMAQAEKDEAMRALAQEELLPLREEEGRLRQALRREVAADDGAGIRDAILEIRPGTGGDEASLFAGDLARMYERYGQRRGWTVELLEESLTELGGVRGAVISVRGEGAYARMRYESGVHRVQRVPKTEASGRIHTSAATVAVLPEVQELDLEIRPEDVKVETYRAGGKGGQHVNKTESAVRMTHLPTGITVAMQDERSQHKNRAKAERVLRARIYEHRLQAQKSARDSARRSQIGTGDRSERIRTYNFPQNRVTDHRIGLTLHRLPQMLDGELDELHDALLDAEGAWLE